MDAGEVSVPSIDETLRVPGYWCEYHLVSPEKEFGRRTVASLGVDSVRSAVQWVEASLRTFVPLLAPGEVEKALRWLRSGQRQTADALLGGRGISISLVHGKTRIEWTIRPVVFLTLASRLGQPLPFCVDLYSGPVPIR